MDKWEIKLKKIAKKENIRKIFAKVFDEETIKTLHTLATQGFFEEVEFVISTGKEAHVFRAKDNSGNYKAIKIYKIETSDFKKMYQYLEGDRRFEKVRKTKREIVFAWAKKEQRNLDDYNKAGIKVPMPLTHKKNILVMEFIGENGLATKTLKENPFKDAEKLHKQIIEILAKMAGIPLIHADLSEYNLLNHNEELIVIDCGQAVEPGHPKAMEFFERDVKNMALYLQKQGIKTDYNSLYQEIKKRKNQLFP